MAVLVRRRDLSAPPVERWQPFPEIQELQEQMGQLAEQIMSGEAAGVWVPLVDIEETEDAWIVEAEVPGVKSEDVNVEVRDSELVITGEIKERERQGILRRKTRRVGRFEFRVTLPGQTDPEKVNADLDDGVLTIRIPKPEVSRPRRIEVHKGHNGHGQQDQSQQRQPAEAAQA
jgi:HSP20 family protein